MKFWKTRKGNGNQKYIKKFIFSAAVFLCSFLLCARTALASDGAGPDEDAKVLEQYREYQGRLEAIEHRAEIGENGFEVVENQIFPIEIEGYGEVSLVPAFEESYHRLALFFVTEGLFIRPISWRRIIVCLGRWNSRTAVLRRCLSGISTGTDVWILF